MGITFLAFQGPSVDDVLAAKEDAVAASVGALPLDLMIRRGEEELAAEMAASHVQGVPTLDFAGITVRPASRMVPAEHFPVSFTVTPGRSYEKKTFIFSVPYTGAPAFLRCHGPSVSLAPKKVALGGGRVSWE